MIIGRFIELKRETSQTPLDQIYMQHILRGTGVVEIFMSAVERIYEASHS